MSAETIQFELVSPEAKLFAEPVKMATIPGDEGQFGIGPDHCALVASLKPGVVTLTKADGNVQKIFITGGFADVTNTLCTILAEQAEEVSSMDQASIEKDVKNLNEDLATASELADKRRIQKRLDLAKARLSAVTGQLVV